MKNYLFITMLIMSLGVHAQDILAIRVNLEVENTPLNQVLNQLEESAKINFAYSRNRIPLEKKITISKNGSSLEEILTEIFAGTGILFQSKKRQIILYRDQNQTFTISGYIRDKITSEFLFGANIYEVGNYRGVYSNKSGFYSLTLPYGKYKIMATYIGYQTSIDSIELTEDIEMDIFLAAGGNLVEIVVTANPIHKEQEFIVKKKNDANHKIDVEKVKNLPSFFGEEDVMMYLQLIPGTSTNGVLGSNINIRGSESDQNLVLLDGIPIYNNLHLFGLVSIFEQNTVKSVDAYTRGFSAVYGGKLSSILDVRLKEGNKNSYHAKASIGLLSIKGFVEGPIKKEKSSFIFSYRTSLLDIFSRSEEVKINPVASYFDLNLKVNFDISKKDKLSFILYQGDDVLAGSVDSIKTAIGIDENSNIIYQNGSISGQTTWGNNVFGSKWHHKINSKVYMATTIHLSRFFYNIEKAKLQKEQSDTYKLTYDAGVEQGGIKTRIDYRPNTAHYINAGLGGVWAKTNPGNSRWIFNIEKHHDFERNAKEISSKEFYLYFEDEYRVDKRWIIQYGMYNSVLNTDDTTYFFPQPRLNLRYHLNERSKIVLSYSKMVQYDRVMQNTSLALGANMWLPSTRKVKPQLAHHFSVDYTNHLDTIWKFTSGIFYKSMKNIVRPKEGVNVLNSVENWEDSLESGDGKAYGLELMLEKTKGRTRGWISYYLGKSTRQFDGLNNGKEFQYKFSKKHNVNLVILHQFKSKKSKKEMGLIWQYASGYFTTIPTRWHYDIWGNKILDYDEINNYRFPATHKLNMSYSWSRTYRERYTWTIKCGVYNVYKQFNIFQDKLTFTSDRKFEFLVGSFTKSPIPYFTLNFGLN